MMKTIFLTGGTGYIGTRLTRLLLQRGHRVISFIRPGAENKVLAGAELVVGDPFDAEVLCAHIPPGSVFVQLLGVPHPSPRVHELFFEVDLPSVFASAEAASKAGVSHFVYVSVAQELSGIMKAYQQVRASGEQCIIAHHLPYTFLRPWYVVGPGHWWPLLMWPLYKILEWLPPTRKKAKALGLVWLPQMLHAMVSAIEQAPENRILEVADIRGAR